MTVDEILNAARSVKETPFRHQGRVPGIGLDCAGVFVHVCRVLGLPVIDEVGYGRNPFKGLLEQCIERQPFLVKVPLAQMQSGDILLMRFDREPQHIAIHAGETVIHSYEKSGKVVEHRFADIWQKRVVRAYRFEGAI